MVRAGEFLLRVGEINLAGLVGDDDASEPFCDLKKYLDYFQPRGMATHIQILYQLRAQ